MRKGDMLKAAVNRHSRSIKICPVLIQFSDDNPNSAYISAAGSHTAATNRATKTAPKSRRAAGGIWDSWILRNNKDKLGCYSVHFFLFHVFFEIRVYLELDLSLVFL
jgi:hypothetical protein